MNIRKGKSYVARFASALGLIALAFLLFGQRAHAQTSGCTEDGGQYECTWQGTYPIYYTNNGSWGLSTGPFSTEEEMYETFTTLAYCSVSPESPPYPWTLGTVIPGNLVSWYANIYVSGVSGDCGMPEYMYPFTTWLTASKWEYLQPCPPGWSSGTMSSNNPTLAVCTRPVVQRCANGQCPLELGGGTLDAADGNITQQETDYSGGGTSDLQFARTYNYYGTITGPGGTSNGAAGQGWSDTYDRRLWFYSNGAIRVVRPDGDHKMFLPVTGGYQEYGTAVDQLIALSGGSGSPSWQFIDENDNSEFYDANGNLLSITYRGGHTVTMSYSTSLTSTSIAPYPGLLIGVSDAFGHQLQFVYNSQGQIQTMTDPAGATYTYTYSGALLTSVQYPDSTTRQYLYNESAYTSGVNIPNGLTGIIDEASVRYKTISYNSSGLGSGVALTGGVNSYSLSSAYGNWFTDPLGTSRYFAYYFANGAWRFNYILYWDPCPACQRPYMGAGYDANGNTSLTQDADYHEVDYAFDLTRNLQTSRTEASGTPQARTITTSWDSSWRQPALVTEANRTTAYTYDTLGNVLTKTVTDTTVTPNTSRTWTYTYDSYGRVLTAQGPRTDVSSVTTYTYYTCTTGSQCGKVHTITDPVGNVTTYTSYDGYGHPLTLTDPNGVVTTLTYDTRQRLSSRQVGSETTSFSYYSIGLLQTVTLPDGSTLQYTYDGAHRLTQVADGAGNYIAYTLNGAGDRIGESAYDPSSTLDRTLSRVYNGWDQLYQVVGAAGTSAVTTTYSTDNAGNLTNIYAPLSRNTSHAYDALNRLTQTTDPNSGVTAFGYDAQDDLTSVVDPRGLTTSYAYNGYGDVATLSSPDTGTTTNTYDSGGNLANSEDARSKTASYTYDAANRVTQVAYGDQTISYTYDSGTYGKGRLTGASDASHSLAWQYDALGRVTSKSQTIGSITSTVGYSYTSGDLATITTPSGQTVTYTYANHQVTGVSVNGTSVLSSALYESFGPVRGWTWDNSSTEVRLYDTDGNPSELGGLESTSYTVDSAFRITGIANASNSALSWSYGYDVLDRLTSASTSSTTIGWTYDANGNRTAQTGSGASTYTINGASNQLDATTGTNPLSNSYDAAGNLDSDGAYTYTFNNRGRLISVSGGSATTSYLYNAIGQRIEKSGGPAGTVLFVYDEAGHLLGEYTSAGTLIEETVWLGDIPVATIQPNGSGVAVFYIHADHLNAPNMVTRPSDGAIMWRWDKDPFGAAAPNQNPSSLGVFIYNFRFPGQYYDQETGLNYNDTRDYDSQIGRYLESDPIGLAGGINTYSYASSNPITHFDPTGLDCQSANGRTVCNYPGGPSFNIPTPPNFPAYLGPNDFLYHSYEVSVSEKCPDNNMMQGLINDPAPGDPMSAASPGGTPNVAQAFGVNNPILSYLTNDLNTGNPLVVNVTTGTQGQGFSPGYVARSVSNGVVRNYGEGEAILQSPWLFSPQFLLDQYVWRKQTNSVAKKCGCNN